MRIINFVLLKHVIRFGFLVVRTEELLAVYKFDLLLIDLNRWESCVANGQFVNVKLLLLKCHFCRLDLHLNLGLYLGKL